MTSTAPANIQRAYTHAMDAPPIAAFIKESGIPEIIANWENASPSARNIAKGALKPYMDNADAAS